MAASVGSPEQFRCGLAVVFLAHLAMSAWVTLLAVFIGESFPEQHAATTASLAILGSYAASVVFAGGLGARLAGVRISLALLVVGLLLILHRPTVWAGMAVLVIALGLLRPSAMVVIGSTRPTTMTTERAFVLYATMVNAGYVAGPLAADRIRFIFGEWIWVFSFLALVAFVAFGLSLFLDFVPRRSPSGALKGARTNLRSVIMVLTSLMFLYLSMAQAQNVFSLLIERDTLPLRLGTLSLRVSAGSLAALHGALGLLGMVVLAFIRPTLSWVAVTTIGLLLCAATFAGLGFIQYPASQWWVAGGLGILTIAEVVALPLLMAKGAKLTGAGRSLFWLAAMLGYLGGASLGVPWDLWSHRVYFGCLTLAFVVEAMFFLACHRGVAR